VAPIKKLASKALDLIGPRHAALEEARQNAVRLLGLPEDNTALDRAAALGFNKLVYHSSLEELDRFEPRGKFMGHKGVTGIHMTDKPEVANAYLDRFGDYRYDGTKFQKNVMPLLLNDEGFIPRSIHGYPPPRGGPTGAPVPEGFENPFRRQGAEGATFTDAIKIKKGVVEHGDGKKSLRYKEYVTDNPARVRSRFAAFDPARINERDLLASGAGVAVGAGAAAEGYQSAPGYAGGGAVRKLAGKLTAVSRETPGKPSSLLIPGRGRVEAAPIKELEDAASGYMTSRGVPDAHRIEAFPEFDEEKAAKIAEAFERMKHNPNDPAVRRSYDAMIEETLAQYKALEDAGIDYRFLKDGEADPYALSPALGYADLIENGKLHVFPTEQGFGTLNAVDDNPLLKKVGRIGDLKDATANDAFRAVHDSFGHFAPGNPFFRHKGEDRAWYAHSKMYSDDALPAMSTETRGQNSWLNFGPYAEHNRTALGGDTVFADQKIGILPQWAYKGYAKGGQTRNWRVSANVEDRRPPDDPTRFAPLPDHGSGAVESWLRRNASWLWDDGAAHAKGGERSDPRRAIPGHFMTVPMEPDLSRGVYESDDDLADLPIRMPTGMPPRHFAAGGYQSADAMRDNDLIEDATFVGKASRIGRRSLDDLGRLLRRGDALPIDDQRQIWREDGVGVTRDGHPMAEISDRDARLKELPDFGPQRDEAPDLNSYLIRKEKWEKAGGKVPENMVLGDALDHPELYDNYPALKSLPLRWRSDMPDNYGGQMDLMNGMPHTMHLNRRRAPDDILSTALHEGQHGVQGIEGWANGTAPETVADLIWQQKDIEQRALNAQAVKDLLEAGLAPADILKHDAMGHIPLVDRKQVIELAEMLPADQIEGLVQSSRRLARVYDSPFNVYQRQIGERQARNTQARQSLTPEERQAKFWRDTEDRPGEAIITGGKYGDFTFD